MNKLPPNFLRRNTMSDEICIKRRRPSIHVATTVSWFEQELLLIQLQLFSDLSNYQAQLLSDRLLAKSNASTDGSFINPSRSV